MIEVMGLSKNFGSVRALHDVTFTVEKGEIVGFLGANGAGKTTTMDIICGCIGADAGYAKVAGFDITEHPIEAKQRLGYLPDVPPLHPEMRVREYIDYAARLHRVQSSLVKERVGKTIDKLSLGEVQDRIIGNLSKGYRQRVALAQAIVHDPAVLVLDEPTEGLDPNQIVQIRELIRSLAGEHTIILSSHILSEVQNTCEKIIIIHKGRIVQQGKYEDLVRNMETGKIYRLRVGRDADRLASELSSVTGIAASHAVVGAVNQDGQEIEFGLAKATDDTVLDEVARRVVNGGYGMRELTLKNRSLEDVFFQLTGPVADHATVQQTEGRA
jgi:ABC-2 type transport system ATP-binding protein